MRVRGHILLATLAAACRAMASGGCKPARSVVMEGDISGRWYGERWDGSARILWLSENRADGGFEVLFHTCYAGKVVGTEWQGGTAAFADGLYRVSIDHITYDDREWQATGQDGPLVHDYEISRITPDSMRYRSIVDGRRYEVRRVEADFQMRCPAARRVVNTSPGGRSGRDAWIRRGVDTDDDSD